MATMSSHLRCRDLTERLTLDELTAKAKPPKLKVFEFQNGEKRTYEVISFSAVMDAAYGKDWRKSEETAAKVGMSAWDSAAGVPGREGPLSRSLLPLQGAGA